MGFKCPNRKGVADFLQEVSVSLSLSSILENKKRFYNLYYAIKNLIFAMTIIILL
jgi:hypothetical protein